MTDRERLNNLSPGVALAWDLAPAAARGPKPSLSLDVIVRKSIALADADGLDGVSMGKVAAALGVTTMALYRYVPTKDDLIALIGDTAVGPPPDLSGSGEWRFGVEQWSKSLLKAYRDHQWVLTVPVTSPPALPNQLAWIDRLLQVLGRTGLGARDQLSAALFIDSYVRGWATISGSLARRSPRRIRPFPAAVKERLDDRFPALAPIIAAGGLDIDRSAAAADDQFTFAMTRILDGLAALTRVSGSGGESTVRHSHLR